MRLIAVGLALLVSGCGTTGSYDLVPRENSGNGRVGTWTGAEATQSTVSAAYQRTWLDHLILEVEVVNHSDSSIVVDPAQFKLTLSSPADQELAPKLRRPIVPASERRVSARLAREAAVGTGITHAAAGLAGLVLLTAVTVAVVSGDEELSSSPGSYDTSPDDDVEDRFALRRIEASLIRERLPQTLLQRVELAPGGSVRGELWFPAKPLWQAMGPPPSGFESEHRITSTPGRRDVECALTLAAPATLGGQRIDYFLGR
jgi:hypothetical protein